MDSIFPLEGMDAAEVTQKISELKSKDIDWKNGKSFCLSYYGGDDVYALTQKINADFMCDNALNPTAFPSLKIMENEVVGMVKAILGGHESNCGTMTSGGTESILMVVKAAREWAREIKPKITEPEVIVPATVHPAFFKAAHYLKVKIQEIPVSAKTFTPSLQHIKDKINSNTILIVGSAPSYPHGVIDPISGIASLAKKNNVLCHIDACIGGLVLGFYRDLGVAIPKFDLKVDGVTSISCDLHKYGFAPKGASVVLYKNKELRRKQFFCTTNWPGGIYISPTSMGTRSGAPIASAWGVMRFLGRKGYQEKMQKVYDTTHKLSNKINNINGLYTLTESPQASLLAIASVDCDIYVLADYLTKKGWCFDRNSKPASIHLSVMPAHSTVVDNFIADLEECFEKAKKEFSTTSKWKKSLTESLISLTPKNLIKKIARNQTESVTTGEGSSNTAAIYGMMGSLEKKGALKDIGLDLMDQLYNN